MISTLRHLISGIITIVVLAFVVVLGSKYIQGFGDNIPDQIKSFSSYTTETTTCMVEKAWDGISEDGKVKLDTSYDLSQVSAEDLTVILSHAQECANR